MHKDHIMTDIETLGTKPGAVILSIGACLFSIEEGIKDKFYVEINVRNSLFEGFREDNDALKWWEETNPVEYERLYTEPTTTAKDAILFFSQWLEQYEDIDGYWANSPSFDYRHLEIYFNHFKFNWPVPYYLELDVRTLNYTANKGKRTKLQNDHNALKDAVNQTNQVIQWLREKSNENHSSNIPARNKWTRPKPTSSSPRTNNK